MESRVSIAGITANRFPFVRSTVMISTVEGTQIHKMMTALLHTHTHIQR